MNSRRMLWLPLTSSTVVVAPLLIVAGVLVSLANADAVESYWLDLSSKSTVAILFLAPGFAALSAWDAARWRTLALASVRTWPSIALRHCVAVAVASTATYGVTLALLGFAQRPTAGFPRFDVLATAVVVTTAYSLVGFTLGRHLPRLTAAPLAFGGVWLWVAYTPAVEPVWLRNVTGNLGTSCCTVDTQLANGALGAPLLLTGALAGAAVLLLTRATGRRLVTATTLAAAGVIGAAWWVADLQHDPVELRTDDPVCEEHESRSFCAWPEHADRLDEAAAAVAPVLTRLSAAGLDVPTRLTEGDHEARWRLNLAGTTSEQWVAALLSSPLSALPPSCAGEPGWGWSQGDTLTLAQGWLIVTAGASVETAAEEVGIAPAPLHHLADQTL